MTCWEILGLTPGAESREIKRRFAQLVKVHRPEDDPLVYQRLRDAYEQALSYEEGQINDDRGEQPDAGEDEEVAPKRITPARIRFSTSNISLSNIPHQQRKPISVCSTLSWQSALDDLFLANESRPEEAETQLADAVSRLASLDLKSRLQFEDDLVLNLSRVSRPLLMLAAAEKFKWHLTSGGNNHAARNAVNDKRALWLLTEAEIAPLFFADMSAIDEVESGERLKNIYQNYVDDAENRPWFDAAVLMQMTRYDLSPAFLGLLLEQIEWSFKPDKNILSWSLAKRFYALEIIHHQGYKKLSAALNITDGVYHSSRTLVSYAKAAEQEHALSCYNLGLLYSQGEDVELDDNRAFFWFSCAAKQGDADAQYSLGICCRDGRGTAQDCQQAIIWLRQSAEQGHAVAQYELGRFYYNNGPECLCDYSQAFYWLNKSAQQGVSNAQNNLGTMYYEGCYVDKNYQIAIEWFSLAAEQGNIEAKLNLSQIYRDDESDYLDYPKAVYWLTQAAEQGSCIAQFNLGLMIYLENDNIPQDMQKAIFWLTRAAEQDYTDAFSILGLIYIGGKFSIAADYSTSFFWCEKAARCGNVDSQKVVSFMYANGVGTERNYTLAWAWMLISGSKIPAFNKKTIRHKLSRRELAEAKNIARQYIKQYQLQSPWLQE